MGEIFWGNILGGNGERQRHRKYCVSVRRMLGISSSAKDWGVCKEECTNALGLLGDVCSFHLCTQRWACIIVHSLILVFVFKCSCCARFRAKRARITIRQATCTKSSVRQNTLFVYIHYIVNTPRRSCLTRCLLSHHWTQINQDCEFSHCVCDLLV